MYIYMCVYIYAFVYFSQAVQVDRTIYISGQVGLDPSSGQLVPGGVVEEAKQVSLHMRGPRCNTTW